LEGDRLWLRHRGSGEIVLPTTADAWGRGVEGCGWAGRKMAAGLVAVGAAALASEFEPSSIPRPGGGHGSGTVRAATTPRESAPQHSGAAFPCPGNQRGSHRPTLEYGVFDLTLLKHSTQRARDFLGLPRRVPRLLLRGPRRRPNARPRGMTCKRMPHLCASAVILPWGWQGRVCQKGGVGSHNRRVKCCRPDHPPFAVMAASPIDSSNARPAFIHL